MLNKIHSVLTHSPGCDLKLDGSDKITVDLNVDSFNIVKKFLHQSKRRLFVLSKNS